MRSAGRFEKVSFRQFYSDYVAAAGPVEEKACEEIYRQIRLPKRATKGSAGYDFFAPFAFSLKKGESITVPTGIRAKIGEGFALMIFPRSGLGFRYRLQLDNTVGIIDSDYYGSDNEGHIMIRLTNDSVQEKDCVIDAGKGFAQGVFLSYGITEDDEADQVRNGGFGSTERRENL